MAEQEKQQEVAAAGKLSLKKLIILIVAGVLLLVAGAAGTFFLLKGQMAEQHGEEPEHDKKKAHAPVIYYELSKPLIVDFPAGSSMELVQVAVTLVAGDQETADLLKKNEPMIRNNLLLVIGRQTPDILNTPAGKDGLRQAMLTELASILEKLKAHGEVSEVLFTSFIMQ